MRSANAHGVAQLRKLFPYAVEEGSEDSDDSGVSNDSMIPKLTIRDYGLLDVSHRGIHMWVHRRKIGEGAKVRQSWSFVDDFY